MWLRQAVKGRERERGGEREREREAGFEFCLCDILVL